MNFRKAVCPRVGLRSGLAALMAVALCLGGAASARADKIDAEMLMNARNIMKGLKEAGYKNVGILKFKAEVDGQKPSYNLGVINGNLANRLESALILANDDKNPLGITRGAGNVAAQAKGNLTTVTGRTNLFGLSYPLAWGANKVQVDAFLTGSVKLSKDARTTTVVIQSFDKKNPGMFRELATFDVPTERSILCDMGQTFVVSRKTLIKNPDDGDKDGSQSAADLNNKIKEPPAKLLDMKILYNGEPAGSMADPDSPGEMHLVEPKEGQKITFVVKAIGDKRIGLVLLVNGVNTCLEDEDNRENGEYTRWILEPGKEYTIAGFFDAEGKKMKEFKVLSDADSKELWNSQMSPKTKGLIQAMVYIEGDKVEPAGGPDKASRGFSLRAGSLSAKAKAKTVAPKSASDAKRLGMQAMSRGLIAGGAVTDTMVPVASFANPVLQGSETIRYYSLKAE